MSIPTSIPELTALSAGVKGALGTMTKSSGKSCNIFGTLGGLFDSATEELVMAIEAAVASATKMLADIAAFISGIEGQINSFLSAALAKIGELTTAVIGMINDAISGIVSAISGVMDMINGIVSGIQDMISGLMSELGEWVGKISFAVCNVMSGALADVPSDLTPDVKAIKDFASSGSFNPTEATSNLLSGSLSAATGHVSGLTNMHGSLTASITPHFESISGLI